MAFSFPTIMTDDDDTIPARTGDERKGGYARIATLGEEIIDPARTIARAVPIALGLVLAIYAIVTVTALAALGAPRLAQAQAPLVAVVEAGRFAAGTPVVRIGAAVASFGVLLSLLAGVSRTAFAMAANGDLPRSLDAVHPRHRVPGRAVAAREPSSR